jgi:hypothetical protein
MANFNTHFNVAALTSVVAATALLSAKHIDLTSALCLWCLGTLGGLLPDIDADNSRSLDIIFNLFTLCVVIISMRYFVSDAIDSHQFLFLLGLPVAIYVVIRYGVRRLFTWQTVHRGICHSLLFLLFCGLVTTNISWDLMAKFTDYGHGDNQAALLAWLAGSFIFAGGVIHLLLDEICSVDLLGARIKRSFGSALKLTDFARPWLTTAFVIACTALALFAPPLAGTINELTDWHCFTLL